MKLLLLLPLAALFLGGCASKQIYSWGRYEEMIYKDYSKPGSVSAEEQVAQLEGDFQKARAKNKPVPPGFHAHLGSLYYQLGKLDQARLEFETEKTNFPESTVFMDRLLANLNKQP
jgi:hypothetical protein